ncbi:ROK family protein [uncultured Thermanaerothrix sp.]|uniref:ROK family protein n=1 Tax=uncultured Thermanaerothrix sp. TaxID=1195149 RepID=UPI00262A3EFA|nr:ROK family protein [uncultured Thermanaerothrix sp.]
MPQESVFCIGIDIGGTKISLGVFDSNGTLYGQIQNIPVPFDERRVADPNRMINLITPFIEEAKEHYSPLIGIGLSICGNVNKQTGEAVLTPNLHWSHMPFGAMVREAFNLPVFAGTDVRAAALAERLWGVAKHTRFFAWCTVGTGYGGYFFLDGKLYDGFHGFAGPFGHIIWDEEGYPCGCGGRGCFETFVAGPAIARAGQAAVDAGQSPLMASLSHGSRVTTHIVIQAYYQNDPAAVAIIEKVARLIAINLSGLVNALDLEMIVLGGGVIQACPELIDRIDHHIRKYLMSDEARRDLRLERETFVNSALYGAAADVFARSGIICEILGA